MQSGLNSEVGRTSGNQASIGACKCGDQVSIAVIWENIIIGVHSLWLVVAVVVREYSEARPSYQKIWKIDRARPACLPRWGGPYPEEA